MKRKVMALLVLALMFVAMIVVAVAPALASHGQATGACKAVAAKGGFDDACPFPGHKGGI